MPVTSEASVWSIRTGWGSEMGAVLEVPLREAVMVAIWAEESMVVLAVNVAVLALAGTITRGGTANWAASSETETGAPRRERVWRD